MESYSITSSLSSGLILRLAVAAVSVIRLLFFEVKTDILGILHKVTLYIKVRTAVQENISLFILSNSTKIVNYIEIG